MTTVALAKCKFRQLKPKDLKGKSAEARRVELVGHLETALKLEHATIPPYLCALFSIKHGTNPMSERIIRSVAIEEMLHMVLVANILNAITDDKHKFRLDDPDFMPKYPDSLPNSDRSFKVHLRRFSEEAIKNFMQIEQPGDPCDPEHDEFATIGQFYAAIKDELEDFFLQYPDKVFIGDPERQIPPEYYYNGGGEVIAVDDFCSARRAIKVIVDEGEGYNHTIYSGDHATFGEERDLAHFFKFKQIKFGRRYTFDKDSVNKRPSGDPFEVSFGDDAVYRANFDRALMPKDKDLNNKIDECNKTYWDLLRDCEAAFNGEHRALRDAVAKMYEFKYQSVALMRTPISDDGECAGPTFEYQK